MRHIWLVSAFLFVLLAGWLAFRAAYPQASLPETSAKPAIDKQPVSSAERVFDPANPPPDMPPLGQNEEAECDSNFISDANVGGRMQEIDPSSATVTVTQVKVTLQLKITIWVPQGASQHVLEHEQGHQKISEHYYALGDKVAAEVASAYLGRQIAIHGSDPTSEFHKTLLQLSKDITAEYNQRLDPDRAQRRYDDLTEHSRNGLDAKDAIAQAIAWAL